MPRLPSTTETALFRIAQEAITNIVRHADASQVCIALRVDCQQSPNCRLTLIIEDDGSGFNVEHAGLNDFSGRFGLFGIRERTSALGGEIKLDLGDWAGNAAMRDSAPGRKEHP
jgi:two-component system NarL family sensor kinase